MHVEEPHTDVEIEPATPERWAAVVEVVGPRAGPTACWCQRFRRHDAPDNRTALQQEIETGDPPVGLVALDGGTPVGWTRVVPRATLPGVVENRALSRLLDDDPQAWWVTCVVVRREHRGAGVGARLLEGAVSWAAEHGATVLDGHPVDVDRLSRPPSPSAVFTGTVSMFRRAGFAEIGRTYPSRPVMRRTLGFA